MLASLLGLGGAAVTLPGTLELGALTAAAWLPAKNRAGDARDLGKLAVVVPAHDEEGGIARCVRSILAAEQPPSGTRLLVVADNCTDATAARATAAGAEVLVRDDPERRGKGYALETAFAHVLSDPAVEAVLVVDADTTVAPDFLVAMARAFAGGADGAQCRYLVGNADEAPSGRISHVALLAFNQLRPRGRDNLGLSAGILGNGFGLHRRVLEALPYTARSVVEDLEYHLMMVREGFRVRFVADTAVTADLPVSDEGRRTQRARWEGGRMRMVREHAPTLLGEVARGEGRLVEPLGELLLLPLATHVGALLVVLVVPFPPTQLYAAGALGVVAAHVATALALGGGGLRDVLALAATPAYVLSKLLGLPQVVRASGREQAWVRTARDGTDAAAQPSG